MTMLPGGRDPVLEIFSKMMTDVAFVRVESPGGLAHVDSLENGLADATLVQADVAYAAFTRGTPSLPNPHTKLRAMAVASVSAMHVVAASGMNVQSLKDLQKLRISAGWPGTNTETTVRSLFPQIRIPTADMRLEQTRAAQMPSRFENGTLDAAILITRYPASMVENIMAVDGVRLISLPQTEIQELRGAYPFFRKVTIPAGTYGQKDDVETVGINIFVCREDLSEEIAYRMLAALFASLPELAERQPGYRGISMLQAPATPIPLHPGAARFFRERQLFR
jgi:uncharacterized protein